MPPFRRITRFQESPWYIKLWRFRYYSLIPFKACVYFLNARSAGDPVPFSIAWSIAVGMAQVKMHWYYTMAETQEQLYRNL